MVVQHPVDDGGGGAEASGVEDVHAGGRARHGGTPGEHVGVRADRPGPELLGGHADGVPIGLPTSEVMMPSARAMPKSTGG